MKPPLRCRLGFHAWRYVGNSHRHCTCCPAREFYDRDEDMGWGGLWVDDNESAKSGAQKGME